MAKLIAVTTPTTGVSWLSGLVNWIKSPDLKKSLTGIFTGNETVDNPVWICSLPTVLGSTSQKNDFVILAIPTFNIGLCTISALKVLKPVEEPPVTNNPLTSDTPYAVIPVDILPFGIPLNIKDSLGIKVPSVS